MQGIDVARATGVVGTLVGAVVPFFLATVSPLVGAPSLQLEAPVASAVSLTLVGYAVWVLSGVARTPNIFRYYLAYVGLSFLAYLALVALASSSSGAALALAIGWFGANIASGVFIFACFARIADVLGYRWFLWSGRLLFVGSGAVIIPLVGPLVGLAGIVLQLLAFYSLPAATV